jgi:2,3-bisphosphoglycerate-dependent phosphoglycerate mutase
MTPIRIFFLRHGESAGNADKNKHAELADHAIPLTEFGREQAYLAGEWLGRYFLDHNSPETKTRFWVSPYRRTRETADEAIRGLQAIAAAHAEADRYKCVLDRREHINLVEQQFGLFDGIAEDRLHERFPHEAAH